MTCERGLNECYPAVPASVPEARRVLMRFAAEAGACEEQIEAIGLASSEAVTNAVQHAYDGADGSVHVTAAVTSDELWVLVADDGHGLRPRSRNRGLGIGLALIACLADTFTVVKRSTGGTELQMRFGLAARKPCYADQRRGWASSAASPASPRFSTTT